MFQKYICIAVLIYNSSHYTSIGCESSRDFHESKSYNIWDLKLRIRPQQALIPNSQIAQFVLDQTQMIYQDVRRNAIQAYIKYKAFYDKKTNASKLKEA